MMCRLVFVLLLLNFSDAFGQNIPRKDGCIEVSLIRHYYRGENPNGRAKKPSNAANRPSLVIYFDTLAEVIEKIGYGKYHNDDLRLLDFVEKFHYDNKLLKESIVYDTDCCRKLYPAFRTMYLYNDKKQLIQTDEFNIQSNNLFLKSFYEYDSVGNKVKSAFGSTSYVRLFDRHSRIQLLQQIYENELRWEWKYLYEDDRRVGVFSTYYKNDNYSKREEIIYQGERRIAIEEKYVNKEGMSTKNNIFYTNDGVISRIDFYESFSGGKDYKLKKYVIVKVKSCKTFSKDIVEKINGEIYDEELL